MEAFCCNFVGRDLTVNHVFLFQQQFNTSPVGHVSSVFFAPFSMGSLCSRRSMQIPVASTPLLPAAVIAQIHAFNSLPASTIRANRFWRLAIRKVITLIRLRQTWASLGRHLQAARTSILFEHLHRVNGHLRHAVQNSSQVPLRRQGR
jgi:hypothetical protein